jgi:hypothetical protein
LTQPSTAKVTQAHTHGVRRHPHHNPPQCPWLMVGVKRDKCCGPRTRMSTQPAATPQSLYDLSFE